MALALSSKQRIPISVGGETVTMICRQPTAKEVSIFLSQRFETKRNKIKSRLYEARPEFVRKILLDVENAQYESAGGEIRPLNAQSVLSEEDLRHASALLGRQVESWLDLIPDSWFSAVAMRFEDAAPDDEDGEGN
ncbi:MAG: hypothetical protein KJZ84_23950 [Bryobacteraceae bacterium]|nr:hypothetical protein [Bryobacteraceae bacterium]